MIRFLSLLSIVCLVATYVLLSSNNTDANIVGVFLIFAGAALALFLTGRSAFLRVRDTAREVQGAVVHEREERKELMETEDEAPR